eukprot:8138798-Alexandrium_andersonii.AAC.1
MSFAHTGAKKRRHASARQRRATVRSGKTRHRRRPVGGAPIARRRTKALGGIAGAAPGGRTGRSP